MDLNEIREKSVIPYSYLRVGFLEVTGEALLALRE